MKKFYLLVVTLFIIVAFKQSNAQSWTLDSSFNSTGINKFNFYNNIDRLFGSVLQPDQKLIVVGLSKNGSFFQLCVARFLVNGQLDTSFSNDGKAYIGMGNQGSIGGIKPNVKLDAAGKIVLVSSGRGTSSQDVLVARLNSNGTPDVSFNGTGSLFIDVLGTNTQPDIGTDFDFDSFGNIYIVGTTGVSPPIDNQTCVLKLSPNGTLRSTFDADGMKLFNPGAGNEFGIRIKVLTNNQLLFGGDAGAGNYLMEIDSTGNQLSSFNGTGYLPVSFSTGSDFAAMEIDSVGRILLGATVNTATSNIGVARFLPGGTADAGFGTNGKSEFTVGPGDDVLTDMKLIANNKLLISGYSFSNATGSEDFMVAQLDATGNLDNTFNNGSSNFMSAIATGAVSDQSNSMEIMNDGRVLLVGTLVISSAVNEDCGIIRIRNTQPLNVEEINISNAIKAYPNPFTAELIIESTNNELITIYSCQGGLVKTIKCTKGLNYISLLNLPLGVYFLRNENGSRVQKIIHN